MDINFTYLPSLQEYLFFGVVQTVLHMILQPNLCSSKSCIQDMKYDTYIVCICVKFGFCFILKGFYVHSKLSCNIPQAIDESIPK